MLREFVIENLGRLRRVISPVGAQCGRLTLIFAPNGYGKTTLSSALRAAERGDAGAIRGRRSLGNGGQEPRVVLTFENGVATYENGAWDAMRPRLSIFDGAFIAENVHAAETISLDTRRSMFSVVLGRDGIALYDEERQAVADTSVAQREEAEARAALRDDLPPDMAAERFLVDQVPADIGERVEQAERRVAAAREGAALQGLRMPEPLPEAEPVPDLVEALTVELPGVGADAEVQLNDHRHRFHLDERGERWLMYGTEHIVEDACPFCGRDDVDAQGLATIYRGLFSEQYLAMTRRVQALQTATETTLGGGRRSVYSRATPKIWPHWSVGDHSAIWPACPCRMHPLHLRTWLGPLASRMSG